MAVFTESFARLRQDLDQSHENRQRLIEDIRANARELARRTGEQLSETGKARRAEFATTIRDLRAFVKRQAEETRGELAALAADLKAGGATFTRAQTAGKSKRWGSRNR